MAINDRFMLPKRVRTMEQMVPEESPFTTSCSSTRAVTKNLFNKVFYSYYPNSSTIFVQNYTNMISCLFHFIK